MFDVSLQNKPGRKGHSSGRVEGEAFQTREGVFDEATYRLLFAMQAAGQLEDIGGVLRTGKEASVFLATREVSSGDEPAEVGVYAATGVAVIHPLPSFMHVFCCCPASTRPCSSRTLSVTKKAATTPPVFAPSRCSG